MKDTRLIALIRNFSFEEIKEFEKFIASPYFSMGRDLLPLFKALKSFYPEFNSEKFTKENIYNILYQGKKYGDARSDSLMRTLTSELLKLCKEFLIYSELKQDGKRKSYYLLNQLRKKKNYKEFDKEYKNSLSEKDNPEKGGVNDFIENYFLKCVIKDYSLDKDDFENAFEFNLTASEYTVAIALINSFKFEDEKNLAAGYNLNVRYNLTGNLLNHLDSEKLLEEMKINNDKFYPYVQIFYMIYMMNKYKDKTEYYFRMKELLNEHSHLFGQSELNTFWSILLTYCGIKKLGIEKQLFTKESFQIYKHILKLNIYKKSEKEDFNIVLFRNIVMCSSALGEYEWLENFIKSYSNELHINHRDNMKYFSLAYLCFAKEQFETALEHIIKIKYDLFMYKIDIKVLLLKIYYELEYFDQAYSTIDATQHYLKNTKDHSNRSKDYFKNLLKYFRELLKLKSNKSYSKHEIEFLEKKIKNEISGDWLLKKIKELKEM